MGLIQKMIFFFSGRKKVYKATKSKATTKQFYAVGFNLFGRPHYYFFEYNDGEKDYRKNSRLGDPVYPSKND